MSPLDRVLHQKNSVRGATVLLIVTLTLSNLLGLVRDRLLAAKIPAADLDTYFAAFRLPDLLTNLIVVGAIAVVFLPIFTELQNRNENEAWQAANAIITIMITLLAASSVILIILMPVLMPLVVPNFSPEKLAITTNFARWLTLTPILFGISYFISGIVNSFHRFLVYALAPLIYNLAIILATAMFAEDYGVAGVIIGVLVGAVLHLLIQLPVARRLGWQWHANWDLTNPAVRRIGTLMVPRLIGLGAGQLATVVTTAIASSWTGAIAFYNLATNIQTMPLVIVANSLTSALFPTLSTAIATNNQATFRSHLIQGIRWILFLLIPASVGLILLRIQIVRLILGAGHFDWIATQVTADILGWLALSLPAAGLITLLARGLYAQQDMKTPMMIGIATAIVTISFTLLLPKLLPMTILLDPTRPEYVLHVGEVAALAIAISLGTLVQAGLLITAIKGRLELSLISLALPLVKITMASLVMGIVVQLVKNLFGQALNLDLAINLLLQTAMAIAAGGLSYIGMAALLGCEECHELTKLLKQKISTLTRTEPA